MAPLLHPAECCVLLIDPRKHNINGLEQATQQALTQAFNLIEQAAFAAAVPCHFAVGTASSAPEDWLAKPSQPSDLHVHPLGNSGQSWSSSGIATAVTAESRSCLVLSGFWLETSVTFIALQALSSGFDVFLLMDATPSYAEGGRGPSSDRLLQAGVVPTTTHQLIAEWAEQAADQTLRSNLSRLIQPS